MDMIEVAAALYAFGIVAITIFQLCLLAGAPWGHLTLGGLYQGKLPAKGKAIVVFSILVLMFMAIGIITAAGFGPAVPAWVTWTAVALQLLSAVMNAITPSLAERRLWAPVTIVMLLLSVYIVVNSTVY